MAGPYCAGVTILHLMTMAAWRAWPPGATYAPESLTTEGFVHCTGDDAVMLTVANRFYRGVEDDLVVVSLDLARLTSAVRWEKAAPPDGSPAAADDPPFPHVYGPLERDAVTGVRRLVRDGAGRLVGYAPIA
jgi:uncharacterized protein (DUF952 family)